MSTSVAKSDALIVAGEEARRRTAGKIVGYTITYIVLVLLAVLTIFPFLWMVSTSLKVPGDEMAWPIQWIPDPATTDNYYAVLWGYRRYFPFFQFTFNSAYITLLTVVGRMAVCSMAGFAFARLNFKGRDAAFAILIAALFMPNVAMIIPLFQAYAAVGWLDTHMPLIMPGIFANTFGTFLMRQFFMTLPKELDDAARIDGANIFSIFWRVAVPLTKPALAALAIFTFQQTWNNFETARIFILTARNQTLPVGLQLFKGSAETKSEYGALMAGATIALVPVLVVYAFLQKYFVQGVALTGIKG